MVARVSATLASELRDLDLLDRHRRGDYRLAAGGIYSGDSVGLGSFVKNILAEFYASVADRNHRSLNYVNNLAASFLVVP